MEEFWIITEASLPVFLMMLIGFLLRAFKCFPEEASPAILSIVVNALIPCLIIDSVIGNNALKKPENLLSAPIAGAAILILGLFVGWICSGIAGIRDKDGGGLKRRTFAVSVGLYNYGYIPFPLAMALYDTNTVGVLLVFNVGVEVCVWTVVAAMLSGYSLTKEWKKIFNMPLTAILVAAILNLIGAEKVIPTAMMDTFHGLGVCAYPLGLVVSGGVIYDLCRKENMIRALRAPLVGLVLRCGILPIIILFLAMLFPFSTEVKRVIVLQAAMPTAVFAMVLSRLFGADSALAFRVVMLTTLLSVVSTPIWIHIGSWMLDCQ